MLCATMLTRSPGRTLQPNTGRIRVLACDRVDEDVAGTGTPATNAVDQLGNGSRVTGPVGVCDRDPVLVDFYDPADGSQVNSVCRCENFVIRNGRAGDRAAIARIDDDADCNRHARIRDRVVDKLHAVDRRLRRAADSYAEREGSVGHKTLDRAIRDGGLHGRNDLYCVRDRIYES
jgi:hypothetical protein